MKTKIEKGLRYLAAGIFFVALLLNVKFTLDSPYFLTGNELVAQTTGTGGGTWTGSATGTADQSFIVSYNSYPASCYYCGPLEDGEDFPGNPIENVMQTCDCMQLITSCYEEGNEACTPSSTVGYIEGTCIGSGEACIP